MPLATGSRLGPYEILTALGAGGMGEVYRARDTKLNRDVALKILPEAFTLDGDRIARFRREAQVLASLNHPNIAAIYGFEDSGSRHALVLELVEGPTLADRIAQGAIPLDDALPIARQVAEALEAAHEQGIVHRDLKPANIKVRADGTVKVLDFGLAKLADPIGAALQAGPNANVTASPTITSPAMMTGVGVILGTAAYMSPEQAHGRAADRRADVFSFGAVLFEMLSGRPAFAGESVSDTLASVLKVDPDWSLLPPATPAPIRRLLGRCLLKDPKRRLQAIGEARIVLENPNLDDDGAIARPPRPRSTIARLVATAFTAAVGGVALWGWLRPASVEPRPVLHFVETLDVANVPGGLALARDGSRLAFVSGPERSIYVRMMDQSDARRIPNTENAAHLGFSFDGQWISFIAGEQGTTATQLKRVALTGGPVQRLASAPSGVGPPTQTWADDGNIYFDAVRNMRRIPAEGGQPQTLATPDRKNNELFYLGPQLLPGGRDVLVGVNTANLTGRTVALNLRTGEKKVLLDRVVLAQYVASRNAPGSGHLLYYDVTSGSLLAVPFDARRLQVQGSPVPVVDGIEGLDGPFGKFGVSDAGMLAYVRGAGFASNTNARMLVWVDRQGHEQATPAPIRRYNLPRLSPGGDLVAMEIQDPDDAARSDIWVYDVRRNTLSRVTAEDSNRSPVWTPDGKRLIYASARSPSQAGLVSAPADRSSPPSRFGVETESPLPGSVSRDGIVIGYKSNAPGPAWTLPLSASSNGKPVPFLDSGSRKTNAVFSPDGHWIAYAADDSGRFEIYVTPYPGPGSRSQISTDGGRMPRWNNDGRELFFRSGDRTTFKMMAVDIELGASLHAGSPRLLFAGDYGLNTGYDVAPDGQRFLMVKSSSSTQQMPPNQLTFVVNWFDELKQRVPAK